MSTATKETPQKEEEKPEEHPEDKPAEGREEKGGGGGEEEKPTTAGAVAETKATEEKREEKKEEEGGGGSWWGGWTSALDKLKKTGNVLADIVSKDFAEFTVQIREDTSKVISQIDTDKVKREVNVVLAQIATATGATLGAVSGTSSLSSSTDGEGVDGHPSLASALEQSLRKPPAPEDRERYEQWRKTFDLQSKTEEISQLLSGDETLRQLHTRLVPAEVSYKDFWENFFWQAHVQEQQSSRRQAILDRVAGGKDEEDLSWDADADAVEENPAPPASQGESSEQKRPQPPLSPDTAAVLSPE